MTDTETITIDLTPSWEAYTESLLLIYTESTSSDDRRWARAELGRMARLADAYVAEHKEETNGEQPVHPLDDDHDRRGSA